MERLMPVSRTIFFSFMIFFSSLTGMAAPVPPGLFLLAVPLFFEAPGFFFFFLAAGFKSKGVLCRWVGAALLQGERRIAVS